MTKNNVLLLYTTMIAISMLAATPLANLAFAEEPDLCEIGASAAAANINPDDKSQDGTVQNVNFVVANNSFGEFDECNYRLDTANIFYEGILVCTHTFPGGLTLGPDDVVVVWKLDGTGVADAGNAQSGPGQCLVDTAIANGGAPIFGPWSVLGEAIGVTFNQVSDDEFQVPIIQVPGSVDLINPTMTVTKTVDPTKARVDTENPTVAATWTIEVTNTSAVSPLTDCQFTDANAPGPIAPIPLLNPGESDQRQYVTNISDSTMNHVDVVCLDQQGDPVTGEAEASIVIFKPAVQIVKECDAKVTEGESALCNLTVTNESPDDPKASLTNCVVTDVAIGFGPTEPFNLGDDPVQFLGLPTPPIFGPEPFVNTAEVLCEDQLGDPVFDDDTVNIIVADFAVELIKECDAKVVLPFSSTIHCEIDVIADSDNTGPLNNCRIEDPSFSDVPIVSGFSLNPGESWPTELVNREVTDQDVIDMVVENVASVTCSSQEDVDNVFDDDNALVEIFSVDASIEEVCTPEEPQPAPGSITWTITICNTSPDGKSDLTLDGSGTFEQCDADGTNCQGEVPEPLKEVNGLTLPASDPFDPTVSCTEIEVTLDDLEAGKYIDRWTGFATMQAGSLDLEDMAMCVVETVGENGCTPGFWKNNAANWEYSAWPAGTFENVLFSEVFDRVITIDTKGKDKTILDPTLEEALAATGGGVNALARHGTAAYLNAVDAEVAFPFGAGSVISMVQQEIDNETYDHEALADANELGCSQNQKGEPIDPE